MEAIEELWQTFVLLIESDCIIENLVSFEEEV
jgi:hypothetical protein